MYLETISSVKCPKFKRVELKYYFEISFEIFEMLQNNANYL